MDRMSRRPPPLPVPLASPIDKAMSSGGNDKSGTRKGDAARAERLRAALRENLKRRKVQAKGRTQAGGAQASHDSAGFVPDKSKD
jgi:hypothetical protein